MSVTIDYTKGFVEGSPLAEKVGTITGTTLDLTSGNVFSYTPTADTTFVFSNPPTTGTALGFTLVLTGLYISEGYDLATASYLQNFSVATQETVPQGIFFKPDGTKMYVIGRFGYDVNEYDLSTAWDVTSASYLQNFSVAAQEAFPTGIFFKPDGTKMYVIGVLGDDVNEYDLSTAWDVSSASYLQNFSVAAQEINPTGVFFKPDGTKMYVIGTAGDDVNEYSTGSAVDATFTYPASVEWPAGTPPTAPAGGETDILTFFTQDGGTTYYGRLIGDNFS